MSILSGFLKTKRRRLTDEGYILQSEWTSASSVEHADGKTTEEKVKEINEKLANINIETDTTLSIEGKAADAKAVGDTKISYTDVVDNLESTETKLPLSANMGRELDEKISTCIQIVSFNASTGALVTKSV